MSRPFDYFVILAEMRTGSNFLESNLNEFPGLQCYGEAFNPYLIVDPEKTDLFGITLAARDADPLRLIDAMKANTEGIPGFRLFNDHDPRVFDHVMNDPRCGKVILNRNLVDAWVSQRIAWSTKQWQLNDHTDAKKWKVKFDPKDFKHMYFRVKDRQREIARRLQVTGQAGFYIDYDDIQDLRVINGLARFLGETTELPKFSDKFKKQNPEQLADKVRNFEAIEATVNDIDRYDLGSLPNFEPPRGASVPSYVTAAKSPLCFMPIPGALDDDVRNWLAALDQVDPEALGAGFTQKELRQWKNHNKGHRSFTVIRHPVERAHRVFCDYVLNETPRTIWPLRHGLIEKYKLPMPWHTPVGEGYDVVQHRHAFLGFLQFVTGSLNGQTAHPVELAWATQDNIVRGFSEFVAPDHLLRADRIEEGLALISMEIGVEPCDMAPRSEEGPFALSAIYDEDVERAVRTAYARDYMAFGFPRWDRKMRG
ncbi:nodulation protein NodH [Maritimibacter sp. DP1N21-5]|uniref:nodulation protein NodH n=1 Tax=Maritimibacter sp. DP1N21-5 TaxID=2836867 RepID=UPI001C48FF43|nr:nodulation protein NodH [Maritimibacter sp. DP1N21-5]MBV7411043.1 nodulation protein NodH [Maritimibacter sp. DP1N21-5]